MKLMGTMYVYQIVIQMTNSQINTISKFIISGNYSTPSSSSNDVSSIAKNMNEKNRHGFTPNKRINEKIGN